MAPHTRHFSFWIKEHYAWVRLASFVLWLLPAAWLCLEWFTGTLGVNPLNRLLHFSGHWALILFIVSLSVTPLRRCAVALSKKLRAGYGKRLSDWNWMIRLRRQFGLFAFAYAWLHWMFYLFLDAAIEPEAILEDIENRPFILLGFAALILLLPLAATSNQFAIRTLGKHWRSLHKLVYVIAILQVLHFWLQMKVGQMSAAPYAALISVLLAYRLWAWIEGERLAGVEVAER